MKNPTKIIVLLLATVLSGATLASEIYKWTDEDGNVHYGDRPSSPDSERMAIRSKPTDPSHVQAEVQARLSTTKTANEQRSTRAEEEASREELRAQAAEKATKCTDYRSKLEKMLQSRRLYRQGDDGERVYLDEDEMLAARERVGTQVEEYCSS